MTEIKKLFKERDPQFWAELDERTRNAESFSELMALSNLRKRASDVVARETHPGEEIRVALVGGSTLYPLSELIEQMLFALNGSACVLSGEFNNFRSELLEGSAEIDDFRPSIYVVIPDEKSCRYSGGVSDPTADIQKQSATVASDLLNLCESAHERHGAEVVLCNYLPLPFYDLGEVGSKSAASDWNFKRAVNLELAERAPSYVHICDLEFLAFRLGGIAALDDRSWFESKQAFSPAMQVAIARESAHIIGVLKATPKKVLVLDLDNTLWGGIIGDDGVEGIELGDTSPRGEAFKAFQAYIVSLIDRGILLGVCSKNDYENAIEPFRVHPEMVLREEHFVSFKANWEPKAANLIAMAAELSLGLDSFVFVDDNPAEIHIVEQFIPEVTTILLSDDPSEYVRQLQESRLFERNSITSEDSERTQQYRQETDRRRLESTAVDMESYLESLEMIATIKDFDRLDVPRIAQLINKSNQFNLTTIRRTESDIESLISSSEYMGFTVRLADRFGDHGLISIVICRFAPAGVLEIDTWLMSCRVLKRQVEHEVLNEIMRRARVAECSEVRGRYLPTAKNGMVRDLLPSLGFTTLDSSDERFEFQMRTDGFRSIPTFIDIKLEDNHYAKQTSRDTGAAAAGL